MDRKDTPMGGSASTVAALQEKMLHNKKILEEQLERGEINAEQFANQVNLLLTAILKEASERLPSEDFQKVFGFQYSGQKVVLIDPKLAAASANVK